MSVSVRDLESDLSQRPETGHLPPLPVSVVSTEGNFCNTDFKTLTISAQLYTLEEIPS